MGAYDQPVSVFYVKHPNDRAPNLACCGCIILQEYDIIYNDGIRQEEHLCPPVKSFARKRGFLMKIKGINEYISVLESNGIIACTDLAGTDGTAPVRYISYNSMDVEEGTLFICKGANFRPQYLDDAIEKGAFCYVAENEIKKDFPHIIVSDMRKAMSEIGRLYYDAIWNDKLQMVGLTGTKGKSTTATFIKSIIDDYCADKGEKEAGFISGIYNYNGDRKVKAKKMTTPETLQLHKLLAQCAQNGCRYLVMETSSQALKYERTEALDYSVAVFLNISEDHISDREHPDIEDYFQSKLKIFDQCRTGCVNLDTDPRYLDRVLERARARCSKVITFTTRESMKEKADLYGYDISSTPSTVEFRLKYGQETEKIKVSIGGSYNASNALAAIAAALALDIPMEYIRSGLAHVKVAGRMELYHMNHKDVDVIVDYAHNKLSYMTLFENIRKLYPDRKILLVFGCHGDKAYNRRKDLGQLANIYADKIILTEQDPGTESVADICDQVRRYIDDDKLLAVITDRGEAIAQACRVIEDGWVMVIAGNGADGYQKRGLSYVELPTDGERVQEYISKHDRQTL